jgi:hypothetical protein
MDSKETLVEALEQRFPKAPRSAVKAQPLKNLLFTLCPAEEWKVCPPLSCQSTLALINVAGFRGCPLRAFLWNAVTPAGNSDDRGRAVEDAQEPSAAEGRADAQEEPGQAAPEAAPRAAGPEKRRTVSRAGDPEGLTLRPHNQALRGRSFRCGSLPPWRARGGF